MRNMSFSHTTEQVQDGSKDVTRRLGWDFLVKGDRLWAIEKGQGLRKGEKVKRIRVIEIVSVIREPLNAIRDYDDDCRREGFPEMTPDDFIEMFCRHMGAQPTTMLNRIEFKYVEEE